MNPPSGSGHETGVDRGAGVRGSDPAGGEPVAAATPKRVGGAGPESVAAAKSEPVPATRPEPVPAGRLEPGPAAEVERPIDLGLERIVFLSDGLFAIAMTILVIDLRVPDLVQRATSDQVAAALGTLLPSVFSYVLSFAIVGSYWVAHWRRFKLIERANVGLAYVNLVLLGFIALIPFPTALMGEHGDTAIAVVVYVATLSAAGIAGFLTWVYAVRVGLVRADAPKDFVHSGAIRALSVPAVMLPSLLLLAVPAAGPTATEASWVLIAPVQWYLSRRTAA